MGAARLLHQPLPRDESPYSSGCGHCSSSWARPSYDGRRRWRRCRLFAYQVILRWPPPWRGCRSRSSTTRRTPYRRQQVAALVASVCVVVLGQQPCYKRPDVPRRNQTTLPDSFSTMSSYTPSLTSTSAIAPFIVCEAAPPMPQAIAITCMGDDRKRSTGPAADSTSARSCPSGRRDSPRRRLERHRRRRAPSWPSRCLCGTLGRVQRLVHRPRGVLVVLPGSSLLLRDSSATSFNAWCIGETPRLAPEYLARPWSSPQPCRRLPASWRCSSRSAIHLRSGDARCRRGRRHEGVSWCLRNAFVMREAHAQLARRRLRNSSTPAPTQTRRRLRNPNTPAPTRSQTRSNVLAAPRPHAGARRRDSGEGVPGGSKELHLMYGEDTNVAVAGFQEMRPWVRVAGARHVRPSIDPEVDSML